MAGWTAHLRGRRIVQLNLVSNFLTKMSAQHHASQTPNGSLSVKDLPEDVDGITLTVLGCGEYLIVAPTLDCWPMH